MSFMKQFNKINIIRVFKKSRKIIYTNVRELNTQVSGREALDTAMAL